MDIKQLAEKGAFNLSPPVKKSVIWKRELEDGSIEEVEVEAWFRMMAVGWFEHVLTRVYGPDNKKGGPPPSRIAAVIAFGVGFGDRGKESLSYEKAAQMNPTLAMALFNKFNEVNGRVLTSEGNPDPKVSVPPTNSGASSSATESVGEQSQKPSGA